MEARAKYTLVGSVIIAMVCSVVALLVWLHNTKDEGEASFYTIYFERFSLSGLQVNSSVTMRGIKVGFVESLQISQQDIRKVKVVIRVSGDTPIKSDTVAVIDRNLLTGLANVDLVGSTQHSPPIEHAAGELFPVIPEGQTTLAAIQDNLPQLVDKTSQVLTRMSNVVSPENQAALSATLTNLKEVSDELAAKKEDLSESLELLKKSLLDAQTLIKHLDERSAQLAKSLVHAGDVLALQASHVGTAILGATDIFSRTTEGYENPSKIILGPNDKELGPGE